MRRPLRILAVAFLTLVAFIVGWYAIVGPAADTWITLEINGVTLARIPLPFPSDFEPPNDQELLAAIALQKTWFEEDGLAEDDPFVVALEAATPDSLRARPTLVRATAMKVYPMTKDFVRQINAGDTDFLMGAVNFDVVGVGDCALKGNFGCRVVDRAGEILAEDRDANAVSMQEGTVDRLVAAGMPPCLVFTMSVGLDSPKSEWDALARRVEAGELKAVLLKDGKPYGDPVTVELEVEPEGEADD